jgi:hypothetical protein
MRLRTHTLALAAFALATCAAALAQEPEQKDQQVIDDFVITRGMSLDPPGKKKQAQAKPKPTPRKNNSAGKGGPAAKPNKSTPRPGGGGAGNVTTQSGGETTDDTGGAQTVKAGGIVPGALALGYTILIKDDAGGLFATDTSREFKTGDQLAIALETNADGYLYMFSAENGRNPELIFPHAQIDGGANPVQAHATATFPTGEDADEKYFVTFEAPPATEHLYVVLSRRPLADVPVGEALVKFCGSDLKGCAWKPTPAQWERIIEGTKGRGVTEAKNTQLAQAGPRPVMPLTLQRGLKVKREDPKPAVVRVNDSPDADILVTEIVLVHK